MEHPERPEPPHLSGNYEEDSAVLAEWFSSSRPVADHLAVALQIRDLYGDVDTDVIA